MKTFPTHAAPQADSGLIAPIVDADDLAEMGFAEALNDRMVMRALAMVGTCTGERGIAGGKMKFLQAEHGDAVARDAPAQARARPPAT